MIQNPFIHRGPLKSSKAFWGRASELGNVYSCLLDSEEEAQSVAILGQRRIGKSSFLYRIFKKELADEMYEEQLRSTITVIVSMQNFVSASSEQFFEQILDDIGSISDECASLVDDAREKFGNEQEKGFGNVLRKLTAQGLLLVILIDEFEAVSKNPNFDLFFFNKLRASMQDRRLAFVISIQSDIEKLWDGELINSPNSSPFFNVFQHFTLRGFTEDETQKYLQQFCSPENQHAFSDDEIALIRRLGGRHPFFLNIAAYHLLENKLTGQKLRLDEVGFEISNDPALLLSHKYYWNTLANHYHDLLVRLSSESISYPYEKDVEHDLHWLFKLSLLEKNQSGGYILFSDSFSSFVNQQANKKNINNTNVRSTEDIFEILSGDESTNLEFKSSLRWDVRENKKNEELEIACLKTIAAFLNTHGGTLIIGIDDQQTVLGLDNDYKTLTKKPNKDGFQLHLFQIIKSRIGTEVCELINVKFHVIDSMEICRIVVKPSQVPAFVDNDKLFFRTGNSTDFAKNMRDAYKYIVAHWYNNGSLKHI
ncbi:MAG TPA: hypothetical protein DCD96_03695 [Flavobacteriales bacterium]|nr:hypothetical protein [Flavobacteriales bacterium]HRJ59259.1 putative DNA binding domain-containing protein [Anaerolineales bacterium]